MLGSATLLVPPTEATPISNSETVFNTDWTSAGISGVGDGAGTITLAGVSGTVTKALLYWHGIDNGGDGATYGAATITVNGNSVGGTSLGDATTNCWGYGSSRAYRADITSLVAGDGAFALGSLESGVSEDANGASLLVFFDDGNSANNRDVVLFGGNDSNFGAGFPDETDGWHGTLSGINYSGGTAQIQVHVADGQNFGDPDDDDLNIVGAGGPVTILDTAALYNGNSVPSDGSSRASNGNLWDIHSFDVTAALAPGANTLTLDSLNQRNDCLGLVLAAIDLPAGAAPPTEICGNGIDDDLDGFVDEDCAAPNGPPSVTGPVSASAVYSDPMTPVNFTATDLDAADTLTLSASGVPAGLTFVDNGNRTGTLSGAPTVAPGTYPVVVSVSDGLNSPGTHAIDVVVSKENCTLTGPPVILSSASGPTTLTANLSEADATLGDRSGKTVVFNAVDSANNPYGPFPATTDSNGDASAAVTWGPEVYSVSSSFAGDAFYNPCATTVDTLVTVEAAQAKATGGGWISNSAGRTSFGFNAIRDVAGLHGQFQLRTANKNKFHGNVLTSLTGSGNNAQLSGTGRWNGTAGYTFQVSVVDNGSSGKKAGDTISIVIRNSGNTVVWSSGSSSQLLKGGNIKVRW